MRKYVRLFLIVVAVISCILMFVYRQKYSKLSLIFQMMNTFQFKSPEVKCDEYLYKFKKNFKLDWLTEERISDLPMWTEIFSGLYTYSAFYFPDVARVFAFSKGMSLSTLQEMKCKLHYDKESHSKVGNVKINILQKNDLTFLLFIECKPVFPDDHVPDSLSFMLKNHSSGLSLSVIQEMNDVGPYTMCIKPSFTNIEIHKTVEFIAYHHDIGINHFIFFDTGLPFTTKKVLLELTAKSGILVTLLPWNVPFEMTSFFENIHMIECLQQTSKRNVSRFLLNVDIHNFLVIKKNNLSTLTEKIDVNSIIIKLEESKFCSEFSNDIFAENLNISFVTLLKTKRLGNNKYVSPIMYNIHEIKNLMHKDKFKSLLLKKTFQRTTILPTSTAIIHTYNNCGELSNNEDISIEDRYMWKYKDILFKSNIYRLFLNNS